MVIKPWQILTMNCIPNQNDVVWLELSVGEISFTETVIAIDVVDMNKHPS